MLPLGTQFSFVAVSVFLIYVVKHSFLTWLFANSQILRIFALCFS